MVPPVPVPEAAPFNLKTPTSRQYDEKKKGTNDNEKSPG